MFYGGPPPPVKDCVVLAWKAKPAPPEPPEGTPAAAKPSGFDGAADGPPNSPDDAPSYPGGLAFAPNSPPEVLLVP